MTGPNRTTQRRIKMAGRWWHELTWFSEVGWACLLNPAPASGSTWWAAGLGFGRTRKDAREAAAAATALPGHFAGTPCRRFVERNEPGQWQAWARRCGLGGFDFRFIVTDVEQEYNPPPPRYTDDEIAVLNRWYPVRDRALRGEATYADAWRAAVELDGRTAMVDRVIGRELLALERRGVA